MQHSVRCDEAKWIPCHENWFRNELKTHIPDPLFCLEKLTLHRVYIRQPPDSMWYIFNKICVMVINIQHYELEWWCCLIYIFTSRKRILSHYMLPGWCVEKHVPNCWWYLSDKLGGIYYFQPSVIYTHFTNKKDHLRSM